MSFIGKQTTYLSPAAVKINSVPKSNLCGTNVTFCQPTIQTDDIAFQFQASESTELITNGSFTTDPTVEWSVVGWSRVLNLANYAMVKAADVNTLSQKGILVVNDYYRVTFTVLNYTAGTLTVGGGTGSALYNGALNIQANGTYIAYFQYNEPAGAGDFIIQGSSSFAGRVDDISVIKISDTSDYSVEIVDNGTLVVQDTVPAANLRISDNIITVDFNWADDLTVSNGCRAIQVKDNTNIFEDTFATDQGWVLAASDITITGGEMRFLSTPTIQPLAATLANVFVIGESYTITYDVTLILGDATVTVRCGKADGTTRSAAATYSETITCTLTNDLVFRFTGAAATEARIDNVTIKKEDNIDGRSECYDLQTSHDCTMQFEWYNSESWGYFDYSTPAVGDAFTQKLRLEATFRGTKYPSTRIIGEDSAGVKSVDYTSLRKVKILDIHRSPDYIHDGIASMFMQDTRLIEDVSYIMEDDYEPSSPNESRSLWKDLMTSRSELQETSQPNLINRNV